MAQPPVVILVEPQLGENIGAVARAMHNFGLSELRLVKPRDGWPNPAAQAMAAGGESIIHQAVITDNTQAALKGLQRVYATTARPRDMVKPAMNAREAMAEIRGFEAKGERVGLMFGPERSGLANEDITLADVIISIPTAPENPSLNLAQAMVIVGYEWLIADNDKVLPGAAEAEPPASKEELLGFFSQLEEALDAGNFWKVAEKKPQMWINIRNMFSRQSLNAQEVRTLRGMIRCLCDFQPPTK